jgi:hypothetical protein
MSEAKQCRWSCEYWAADMDDEYCAHPEAMKLSPFGLNLDRALGPNGKYTEAMMKDDPAIGICGRERKLWKIRSLERMPTKR